MTRIGHQNLTALRRTGIIAYSRTLEYLVMYNNNPVPLYVRLGSEEIPSELNYDIAVPPNYILAISVSSNQFGFRLGNSNVATQLITGNTVIEATIDEPPPSLGGVPINVASLATADLSNGVNQFTGVQVIGIYNLNLWGGLVIPILPDPASGQGVVDISISNDGITWSGYQVWAFWPNIPATLQIPRVAQYMRVTVNATAIIGEPAISGRIGVRGTLSQILEPSYLPIGAGITKTYALAPSASQQWQFVTTGITALSIAAIATVGTGAGAAITLLVEASSDLVNWRRVTYRTQSMSTGVTLYRALGNLDLFMRVTVFEVSGANVANGTVYLSTPREADLASMLNNILAALGDTEAPGNTRQDIFHELKYLSDTMLASISTGISVTNADLTAMYARQLLMLNELTAIDANSAVTNTDLTNIYARLLLMLNELTNIDTNTSVTNADLTAIYARLLLMLNELSAIDTNTAVTNADLTAISAQITTLQGYKTASSGLKIISLAVPVAGTWTSAGAILTPGQYIQSIRCDFYANVLAAGQVWKVGIGTAASPFLEVYMASSVLESGGNSGGEEGPTQVYDSERSGGYLIPVGYTTVWVWSQLSAGTADGLITTSP